MSEMIKITVLLLCCILVASCGSLDNAPAERMASKPLNDIEKNYIAKAEADGRLLFEKDIRAAAATDLLLERIRPGDYPDMVGWITYPNHEDFTVSFYEKSENDYRVVADVHFAKNVAPEVQIEPERRIADFEKSMIKARLSALNSGVNRCSDRFNTVVMPSESEDAWNVYVLAATTRPDIVQVGGHIKKVVSKTSSEILETMPLSRSCLALQKAGDGLPEDADISMLFFTHIVTPMPEAIHAYLNLLHDIPLMVSTERGTWTIESGNIKFNTDALRNR